MNRRAVTPDVRAEWMPFSLDPRTEWWAFIVGPFVLLFLAARVWRSRHRPDGG